MGESHRISVHQALGSGSVADVFIKWVYAEQLETLIVEFSGESDTGILYLLNGCSKLRKLVIMNSPIGDAALLAAADKYERLQFFWMSSCNVTLEGCKALTKKVPKLNIEIMKDGPLLGKAELKKMYKIYMYRSLDVGSLLYVRVVKANTGMNPELSCTNGSGKAGLFGILKNGYMFETSTGLARMLLSSPTCPVLEALGKKLSFEIATGLNGRVWVNATSPSTIILVANAIMNSESLSGVQQRIMVDKLLQRTQ